MSGEPPVLGMAEAVIRETSLLLKVESEGPDFVLSDLLYIRALSSRNEEILKVSYAASDYSRGIWAFSFGGRAKLVTMK